MSEAGATDFLLQLDALIASRLGADAEKSYVAKLTASGEDAVLRKIAEESTELILAAKSADKGEIVHEAADLWFHSMVLLANHGISSADVMAELKHRFGQSGLVKKSTQCS